MRKLSCWGFPWAALPKRKQLWGWQFSSLWSLEEQKSLLPAPEQSVRVPARTKEAAPPQRPRSLLGVSQILLTERPWVVTEAAGGSGGRHPPPSPPLPAPLPQSFRGQLCLPACPTGWHCWSTSAADAGRAASLHPLPKLLRVINFSAFSDMAASRCTYRKAYEKISMFFKGL